jgi:hypothetical protein
MDLEATAERNAKQFLDDSDGDSDEMMDDDDLNAKETAARGRKRTRKDV